MAAERPGCPVVLMHFDEPLPLVYRDIDEPQEPAIVLALSLESPPTGTSALRLGLEPAPSGATVCDSLALSFLSFLLSDATTGQAVGKRLIWRWERLHEVA
ncbi:MAG: beta-ketoacyl synthase chain length factor [Rhodospirillaceae bacterium]